MEKERFILSQTNDGVYKLYISELEIYLELNSDDFSKIISVSEIPPTIMKINVSDFFDILTEAKQWLYRNYPEKFKNVKKANEPNGLNEVLKSNSKLN